MSSIPNSQRDHLYGDFLTSDDQKPIGWKILQGLTPYQECVEEMEQRVEAIHQGNEAEQVLLVEHPPLYTAGTSAKDADLLDDRFEVFKTGRGGEHTYHGPGQRICYAMLDLNQRKRDVRAYVATLEQWIINTLDHFNVVGERRDDRVGVWVMRPDKSPLPDGTPREDKIAAIGIRVRRWVTYHGISINVDPDLSHYEGIIPCGVTGHGVTSLVDLGLPVSMEDVDIALKQEFENLFGTTKS